MQGRKIDPLSLMRNGGCQVEGTLQHNRADTYVDFLIETRKHFIWWHSSRICNQVFSQTLRLG